MNADAIAQLVASLLNAASTLLPLLDELKAAEENPEALKAKRDELTVQADAIADALRQG